ncbi:response regulator [Lysobacter xanthus]
MKLLMIEDHPVMRFGVRQLVQQQWPTCEFVEAPTLQAGVEHARHAAWDLILLDLSLPDSNGIEGLVRLRRVVPSIPVLVLSMHNESAYAARALQSGASGYVTKEHATTELLTAIDRVVRGGRYLTPSLAERLVGLLAGERAPTLPHEALSTQEYRVLLLIASGKAAGEIAETMHLSVKTVGTYRARIIEKTGLSSTAEMARYCVQHGLLVDA